MKIQPKCHLFQKEIHAMKAIWEHREEAKIEASALKFAKTPQIVASGSVVADKAAKNKVLDEKGNEVDNANVHCYIIMPRYGSNLETYFEHCKRKLSRASCY